MAECQGKKKYRSLEAAEHTVFLIWKTDPRLKLDELHAYRCPRCKHFHVGHPAYYQAKLAARLNKNRKSSLPGGKS